MSRQDPEPPLTEEARAYEVACKRARELLGSRFVQRDTTSLVCLLANAYLQGLRDAVECSQ